MRKIDESQVKPLVTDVTKSQILNAVNFLEDTQKMRISMGNRICASFHMQFDEPKQKVNKEELTEEEKAAEEEKEKMKVLKELVNEYSRITDVYVDTFKSRGKVDKAIVGTPDIKYILNSYDYFLMQGYMKMLETEDVAKKLVEATVKQHPMWSMFFEGCKGVGALTAGRLIARLNIDVARHVSCFWSYCGIGTRLDENGEVVAMSRKALIEVEYTDKNGEIKTKKSIGYNPELQKVCLGIMVPSIIKTGKDSKYWKAYYNAKNRYTNRADLEGESKMHIHRMAVRYCAKCVLRDLWVTWREYAGYEVTTPYEVEFLNRAPHEFNEYHIRKALESGQYAHDWSEEEDSSEDL